MFTTKNFTLVISFFILFISSSQAENITIGTGTHYPPIVIVDNQGKLSGFEVEIGQAVCQEMKVECNFISMSYPDLFLSLQNKKIDFIMNATPVTQNGIKGTTPGNVYMHEAARFLKLKSTNLQFVSGGLKNKKVGVRKDTPYYSYLVEHYANELEIKPYDKTAKIIDGLIAGEIDFMFASEIFLSYNYVSVPNAQVEFFGPQIFDDKWFGEGTSAYFRAEDQQLRNRFNAAIKMLRVNKEFQKISQKYFQRDVFNFSYKS